MITAKKSSFRDRLRELPWQLWVVVGLLALEGIGNFIAMITQPIAAVWLGAKIIIITGFFLRWKAIFVLSLLLSALHVAAFLRAAPIIASLNLVCFILVAMSFRHFFPKAGAFQDGQQSTSVV